MNVVAIVDYGLCNLDSVARAIEECGGTPVVTTGAGDIERANRIVLPGVGSFPDAMRNLRELFLDQVLTEQVIGNGIPFLGICLGMQLMATRSFEGAGAEGLGWIEAEVRRLRPDSPDTRVPHVGWNEVHWVHDSPIRRDIPSGKDMYFVHSFHMVCRDPHDELARTPYCGGFVSAVQRRNLCGVQFHPEKSQRLGMLMLRNFLGM